MSNLIISVEEAREILGESAQSMSDNQIEDTIVLLDIIAKEALKQAKVKRKMAERGDIV